MQAPAPFSLDVRPCDPDGSSARRMRLELWAEIEARYGFVGVDPFDPGAVEAPRGGFWVAFIDRDSAGSVALLPLDRNRAELDVMYVSPRHRRRGVAGTLLTTLEDHARSTGTTEILLRAGAPQPEALAFYRAAGFEPAQRFGRWVRDETALCFSKQVAS